MLLVHERLEPGTRDVLEELACGNGYNLARLAERNPSVRFVGIDLIASQVSRARAALADLPLADARIGDFHSLEAVGDASQDCVYAIESLCHATDLSQALREIARVLRSGGQAIVIDGWRTAEFASLPVAVREATLAVEHAMAVSAGRTLPEWKAVAAGHGLVRDRGRNLTAQIAPNLARLEAIAARFVSRPRLSPARAGRGLARRAADERGGRVPHAADRAGGRAHVPADRARAVLTRSEAAHGALVRRVVDAAHARAARARRLDREADEGGAPVATSAR